MKNRCYNSGLQAGITKPKTANILAVRPGKPALKERFFE